tara:strand:+ start:352 stop:714 length:363 start_codon:yes stop_codon:yes gene_type:complete
MDISYAWDILQMERQTSNNFVRSVDWVCTATDGDFTVSTNGTCNWYLETDYATCNWMPGKLTHDYAELTKEIVLGWVFDAGIDKTSVESSLESQIEQQRDPIVARGLPWEMIAQPNESVA